VLPILYISNTEPAATDEIQLLIKTMTNNGFHEARLLNIIARFLLKGHFPGIKVDTRKILTSLST
jgi:hypothetical protein